jgi:beta-N-acetylhexosaminidase
VRVRTAQALSADVGQILWLGFEGVEPPEALTRDISAGDAGAVILFQRNLRARDGGDTQGPTDVDALVALTAALHAAAPAAGPPLWIAIDQEGGSVQRVRAPGTVWPPMLAFDGLPSEIDGAGLAERIGEALGRELAALGIDVDFAPVLDVHTNPANPVIGRRAFATAPEAAAGRALALARGLERAGVVSCGKHYPGHGDTDTDSHLALPRLSHDLERLEAVELLPFRRAVAAGIPMIMTAHVVFAALDDAVPATLSRAVITGLLRERMGYGGIIVSDDLDMRAIAAHIGVGDPGRLRRAAPVPQPRAPAPGARRVDPRRRARRRAARGPGPGRGAHSRGQGAPPGAARLAAAAGPGRPRLRRAPGAGRAPGSRDGRGIGAPSRAS